MERDEAVLLGRNLEVINEMHGTTFDPHLNERGFADGDDRRTFNHDPKFPGKGQKEWKQLLKVVDLRLIPLL